MNAYSRNALASLTLLFTLSALVQAHNVKSVPAIAETACLDAGTIRGCAGPFITGSTSKTADTLTQPLQFPVEI
ncbi:MAG: hypothetical protein L3J67_08360 [Hyphomicrobiaceae bacterium]|nr:hypothetical protein [Hyphomicrobiaceae bacterium]